MVAVSSFPAVSRLLPREPVLGDRRALSDIITPSSTSKQQPATTPTGIQTGAVVRLSVRLPLTMAAFNTSVQQAFKEVMAVAAGLARSDSGRVTLVVREGGRRLLASSVGVDVTIGMPDAAAAKQAAALLTADRINAGLAAAGLPAATITSAPAVSTTTGSTAAAVGGRALAWAALAATAAVCAAA